MGRLDDLLTTPGPPERRRETRTYPKGWEPRLTMTGQEGEVVAEGDATPPDDSEWQRILEARGLPCPDGYRVEVTNWSSWDGWGHDVDGNPEPRVCFAYKGRVVPVSGAEGRRADVDTLVRDIGRRKPRKPPAGAQDTSERALVACLADWQLGKGEGGGTAATVERILDGRDQLVQRIKEMKRVGRPVDAVYLLGLGDVVEGCSGFYAMQEYQTDLDEREQNRVARRLIAAYAEAVAPLVPRVVLAAVAGNHGERRKDGKAYTTFSDNRDLEAFELAGEALQDRGYENVSTVLPDEGLTLTVDVAGVPVALAHGHQVRGADAMAGATKWWQAQALGNTGVADARILLLGHRHHFASVELADSGRTIIQAPSQDGGSLWFRETAGRSAPPGLLTFGCGEVYGPRGYGDLAILA